ncbi:hypothetical protein B0O80DRAFT_475476 [Mortierella sp. GBAus27b]|nr:hypothetical protein B0O80DRAFT_475476 [Mortierella sp. GBAus27b]
MNPSSSTSSSAKPTLLLTLFLEGRELRNVDPIAYFDWRGCSHGDQAKVHKEYQNLINEASLHDKYKDQGEKMASDWEFYNSAISYWRDKECSASSAEDRCNLGRYLEARRLCLKNVEREPFKKIVTSEIILLLGVYCPFMESQRIKNQEIMLPLPCTEDVSSQLPKGLEASQLVDAIVGWGWIVSSLASRAWNLGGSTSGSNLQLAFRISRTHSLSRTSRTSCRRS